MRPSTANVRFQDIQNALYSGYKNHKNSPPISVAGMCGQGSFHVCCAEATLDEDAEHSHSDEPGDEAIENHEDTDEGGIEDEADQPEKVVLLSHPRTSLERVSTREELGSGLRNAHFSLPGYAGTSGR